jgi:hypothetical protein
MTDDDELGGKFRGGQRNVRLTVSTIRTLEVVFFSGRAPSPRVNQARARRGDASILNSTPPTFFPPLSLASIPKQTNTKTFKMKIALVAALVS